ncbi:MAG: nucleoside deaminase [Desulfobacterales bacterium]|nr:MAG: nucleoside deaminase [Desulfobacterales bacterium]
MDDEHFMRQALEQAEQALAAGEFPVGCVLVYRDNILATGHREGTVGKRCNEIDHAEMIALRRLTDKHYHIDWGQITTFSTMEPCLMCYSALIIAGIGRIVYAYEDVMGGGTCCDLARLNPLYKNSAVKVVPNVLRAASLKIFKTYFADPENHYLKQSLLAEYTLRQEI